MSELPAELRPLLRLMHETVDRTIDAEIERLQQSRPEKHAEVERFLNSLLAGFATVQPVVAAPHAAIRPTNGNTNGNGRRPFPLKEKIKAIITEAPDDADIDQPSLYARLTADHPALRDRVDAHLKGQISGVLGKLTEEGFITVAEVGSGSAPHLYRKTVLALAEAEAV